MCRTKIFLAMIFNEIKCHVNTSLGLVGGCIPWIPHPPVSAPAARQYNFVHRKWKAVERHLVIGCINIFTIFSSFKRFLKFSVFYNVPITFCFIYYWTEERSLCVYSIQNMICRAQVVINFAEQCSPHTGQHVARWPNFLGPRAFSYWFNVVWISQ